MSHTYRPEDVGECTPPPLRSTVGRIGLTMEEKRHGLINEKMSERTPLIQNVPVEEQQERYPHHRVSAIAVQYFERRPNRETAPTILHHNSRDSPRRPPHRGAHISRRNRQRRMAGRPSDPVCDTNRFVFRATARSMARIRRHHVQTAQAVPP